MGKKGLNWAKALPEYQKILNEEPKEVLKYKSPFEVYFARKPSSHTNRAMECEDLVSEDRRVGNKCWQMQSNLQG